MGGPHPARPPSALDRKLGEDREREALVSDAWRLVKEGLDSGTLTLKNGKVVPLDSKDQIRLIQWLASFQKKGHAGMPLPKELFISQTQ